MKTTNEHGTLVQTTGIDGVIISMSSGLYVPLIQVIEYQTDRKSLCEPGSRMAQEAGLDNPRHWAHAVYQTLERLCRENQAALQGGSMDAYEETRMDRLEAENARRHGNN